MVKWIETKGGVMRIGGALVIIMLIAVAVVLYLRGTETREDVRAVQSVSTHLRESGVEARSFDRDTAVGYVHALEGLIQAPEAIASSNDRLKAISEAAAGWAQGAPAGSPQLDIAVALRSAADELTAYGLRGGEIHLAEAKQQLDAARAALSGRSEARPPTADVRDRLQNLERSQQEQMQHLDEALQNK
ncbi:MAG: hypothetical protein GXP48_11685 [Acidobacteria bacterium]|nr:hypothetical protein [Acidobacteriota bacterium]